MGDPVGPYHQQLRLEKYHDGRGPQDGEPDEVELVDLGWFDPSGLPITDPARVQELEAGRGSAG